MIRKLPRFVGEHPNEIKETPKEKPFVSAIEKLKRTIKLQPVITFHK